MKKYIDADKLIETLIELQEIPTPGLAKVTNEAISLGLSLAVREVRKSLVADVEEVKWIDVKERTPDNNKSVLCYCINTSTEGRTKTIGSYVNNIWFLGNGVSERSYPRHYWMVTHWMPLPEPPQSDFKE